MERILIIGNMGAGKTTFARSLAEKTGLPLVHLDRLYWRGTWEHLSREEFDSLLQQQLEQPRWILDGNFNRTIPHRLQYCDTVFFLDLPALTCLVGITRRTLANLGKSRPDMGGNCPERFDIHKRSLYRNVLTFNRQHRKNYYRLLENAPEVRVTVFRSRRQIHAFLRSL